jgi:hypothetical protein
MAPDLAQKYRYITEIAMAVAHDEDIVVGQGCDDQRPARSTSTRRAAHAATSL